MSKEIFSKRNNLEEKKIIKTLQGNTYDEIAESVGGIIKNTYISTPETIKQLSKNHNLRSVFLSLVGAKEPIMVNDLKDKLSLTKPARYALFHKLREMGLIKKVSILNVFFVDSPHVLKEDFTNDDLEKFNKNERELVRNKFRIWTKGLKSQKQKQTYFAGAFYWTIDKKGKNIDFLKRVVNLENNYRKNESEEKHEK